MKPLNLKYDEDRDIIEIEGVRYSGDMFRYLGFGPLNQPLKIEQRSDGVLVLVELDSAAQGKGEGEK